ncbi:MAG: arylsulfatase [Dysgonamonadaceae bacterium]|jgi:arylsulfatase A-like enzyme|nr:arylsulfatase [Dysgonamonadaceae bacterium]
MNKISTSLTAVFVLGSSGEIYAQQAPEKPNLILIMTDQQRFDCVGAMGNKNISTPNIDQLAKDGFMFRNAYTSTPSSTPARAGLLTGSSPWKHGMLGYSKVAKKYPNEMPQMLKNAGYYTFGIGKMHYTPQRNLHGFDGTLLDESGRVESPDFVSDYRQWFAMQAPGEDPDATGIKWNEHTGKVYVNDEKLHPTQWTGNEAIRFIRNYHQANPLFLKISFARPHSPYDPPQRYYDMYKNTDIPSPFVGDWCERFADRPMTRDAAFGDFGIEHAIDSRKHYYATVTFVDDQIGRIISTLKENGTYDNSWIIFISDHGDMLGDHYHWRKTYAYEGSSHIPFIVKPPKNMETVLQRGESLEQAVEIRDVLPTFLEIAKIPQPENMDGMSVVKLLKDKEASWRPYIDMEHATCYENANYWAALTDGKMKYIWFFHTGEEQLFDLSKDPGELKNLVPDKNYSKITGYWRKEMITHLAERGEPYVKDGKLQIVEKTILLGRNYPEY